MFSPVKTPRPITYKDGKSTPPRAEDQLAATPKSSKITAATSNNRCLTALVMSLSGLYAGLEGVQRVRLDAKLHGPYGRRTRVLQSEQRLSASCGSTNLRGDA